MKVEALKIYKILKKLVADTEAEELISYMEVANEQEITRVMELKIQNLATREGLANLKENLANVRAELIKWMFIFLTGQTGIILGVVFAFFKR